MKRKITIDLTKWTTITDKAASIVTRNGKGTSTQYVSNMILSGKLKSRRIEELNITLVEK